ncbi:hypothetical protein FB451DRAFT_1372254 [Mycena latifolia]|nr:hypothetical protein FB451DRAFT_1372254 [Mycena latifolia]
MDPMLTSNEPLNDAQTLHIRHVLDDTLTAISDLEGEISKTLLSLLKLENERRRRSKYAGTLKGALSPLRRIPPEILAEIFLFCRDDSLQDVDYSVADPRCAPMLLGQIASRWRHVCHGSPRLWDHFHVPTNSAFVNPTAILQPILARSQILPLHVRLERQDRGVATGPVEQDLFDLVLRQHHRVKHIRFEICSPDFTPPIDTINLPILSSLAIILHPDLDVVPFLTLFKDAPQLRSLHLDTDYTPIRSLSSAMPWAQMTRLNFRLPMDLREARAILMQCETIQECRFDDLSASDLLEAPQRLYQLDHLQRLTIWAEDERIPATFFAAFSFPKLLQLDIYAAWLSPDALSNLCDRSKFKLTHLVLHDINLSTQDLVPFFRRLSALQALELVFCAVDDELFKAFTYDPNEPTPSFSLPQLTSLTVTEGTERLNGACIAHMAESVCRCTGGLNAAFPALISVHLWVDGPQFQDDIEARIAAVCATGPVVDHVTRYRRRDDSDSD